MDRNFWEECWEKNEIGFHKEEVNPTLLKYYSYLNLKTGQSILIPLCGKSLDIYWLAKKKFQVTGVEFCRIACEQFFAKHKLHYTTTHSEDGIWFHATNIRLYCGDFFTFHVEKPFDAVYDRAATIALPKSLRKPYHAKVYSLCHTRSKILLSTVSYDQSRMNGPPFSVPPQEIIENFHGQFQFDIIEECQEQTPAHIQNRGLDSYHTSVMFARAFD